MQITYSCLPFSELTNADLYKIMKARQEVFVVEQNCPYLDADGKDLYAHHVMGKDTNGQLQCYSRILPEGVSYPGFTSIGRVINTALVRGQGQGKTLMQYSIAKIKNLYPDMPVKIGAQAYLKKFYESFGFVDMGIPYLEDGIPHIIMVLQ
ncbi:MAG: GNAT family N-acetyltransferase [Saprospiraceae bacterium]|nr:GNAT family N-acetyltransferase [Saprospiraceae bacterium]MBL0098746.1 GNAT family N-acetyltransferase [Saprospiraceae bacterium]